MSNKISVRSKIVLVLTILGCVVPTIYRGIFPEAFLLYHSSITAYVGIGILFCGIIGATAGIFGIFRRNEYHTNSAICSICTLICLTSILLYLVHSLSESSEKPGRISCASNLKQIALALQQYSMDYAGYFPQASGAVGLELLRKNDYLTDYTVYVCPRSKTARGKDKQPLTEENVDYVYIGGLNTKSDPKQPLMYDKANNHGYYGNVLFADGTVEGIYGNPWTQNIRK